MQHAHARLELKGLQEPPPVLRAQRADSCTRGRRRVQRAGLLMCVGPRVLESDRRTCRDISAIRLEVVA